MARRRWGRDRTPTVDFSRYTDVARRATVLSNVYATQGQHAQIETEHLALALTSPTVREDLNRFVPVVDDVSRLLDERGYVTGTITGDDYRPFSTDVRAIITATFALADAEGRDAVGTEHLLFALLERPDTVGALVLLDLGVDPSRDLAAWRVTTARTPGPDDRR